MRTGVSRSTMALDPEALQNQTATANQNQKDSAYSQIELIARNQAELGWRRVFRQLLKLIVKHQDRPRTIRLRDTWVEMDPRAWNANMDVTVNIGLGTGSRDRDMAMLNQILNVQMAMTDRFASGGFMDKALDMLPKINTTAVKLAESAGIRSPDQFYLDIKPETVEQMKQQAAQRPPDPKVVEAQGKLQIQAQSAQADHQLEQTKMAASAQNDALRMDQEFALKREQMVAEFQLRREQMVAEMGLRREEMLMDAEIKREANRMNAAAKAKSEEGDGITDTQMGGQVG
jgi:hypothetical protein